MIACWIVLVELLARITADVESGNRKRQKRDGSIGDDGEFSYRIENKSRIFRSKKKTNDDEFFVNRIIWT